MDDGGSNYYKKCRKCAGLTQETVAEMLSVGVRTLASYETGERIPPDDIVDRMADLYKTPMLAWWHLKNHSILGHHLPDVVPPQSDCDMALQSILMGMILGKRMKWSSAYWRMALSLRTSTKTW